MKRYSDTHGYIALITVIILTCIMLALITSISTGAYTARKEELNSYSKELAYFLAYSCLDRAILNVSYNWSYEGNEVIDIDTNHCTIGSIQSIGANKQIPASATFQDMASTILVTIDADMKIISFSEQ